MRFNCERKERKNPQLEWHKWFAWYPVEINGTWVWLENLERRLIVEKSMKFGKHIAGSWNCDPYFEHREIEVRELINSIYENLDTTLSAGIALSVTDEMVDSLKKHSDRVGRILASKKETK